MADVINHNGDSLLSDINGGDTVGFSDTTTTTTTTTTTKQTPPNEDTVHDQLIEQIAELERENADSDSRLAELKSELDSLRLGKDIEFDRAESERKAAEMIAKRASELEGEVARLQHDLISALNESSEARDEIQSLHKKIDELKREKGSVEEKVKVMAAKMEELMEKSEASEKYVAGLMEKITAAEAAEATRAVEESEIVGGVVSNEEGLKAWKEKVPMIGAVSAAVAAVAAVVVVGIGCYVKHSRN